MHITIIGGSGFVGTRLAARLIASGHAVTIADKNDSRAYPDLRVYADVRKPDTLEEALVGSDLVINLAAEHRDDVTPKSLYDDVNVCGAENMCDACAKLKIKKIIFTSSLAVYGFAPIGTDETGSINGSVNFLWVKAGMSAACRGIANRQFSAYLSQMYKVGTGD